MDQKFTWDQMGNIQMGRENLGSEMPIAIYRLFQYTLIDVLNERMGEEAASELIRNVGYRAGRCFAQSELEKTEDFNLFAANLQRKLKDLKIGIFCIEKVDMETLQMVLTVSEDLDCSGLPVTGDAVCVYDEGFIAGILYEFSGREFCVKEIDCWATGDRTCRFTAEPK